MTVMMKEDNIFVILKNGKNGSINKPRGVSMSRHVYSEKKKNQTMCKIKRVDPNRPDGGARAWGDTDLAWRMSSPFHKSGVPLWAKTHLRGLTI